MTDPLRIQATHLTLRPFELEDAAKVFAMSQEPGIRAWIPDQVYEDEPAALEVLRYLITQYQAVVTPAQSPYVLGVCLKGSWELIGHVGLSPLDGLVEIGYAIEEKHQGNGYATQAVTAMTEWGTRDLGLHGILGIVGGGNIASRKVLEHAGFELISEAVGVLHGWRGSIRTYRKEPPESCS